MHYATKITMKSGCTDIRDVRQVDEIHVVVGGRHIGTDSVALTPETAYDFLLMYPDSIRVGSSAGPVLKPVVCERGDRYVRTMDIDCPSDALMALSRALPERL